MKFLATLWLLLYTAITPSYAQTEDEFKQQLDAQKEINELLKQRIRTLEQELLNQASNGETFVDGDLSELLATSEPEPEPDQMAGDPEQDRALERALVRQGLSVLPNGVWEIAPSLFWSHDGSSSMRSGRDDYLASLDARVGLPGASMIGIGVPYILKTDREEGDNSGFGDVAIRYWKQFRPKSKGKASITGSIRYRAPTAEDSTGPIPLGSEFHRLSAILSSSKSIDPVVLSGSLSYGHSFSENINGREIQPGDSVGLSGSASLAVTPDISSSVGLSVSFIDEFEVNGNQIDGSKQTVGSLNLGTGFVFGKGQFLSVNANIGITDDAPDFSLGVASPFRF